MQRAGLTVGELIAELSSYDPTGHLRILVLSKEFGDSIVTVEKVQAITGGKKGEKIIGVTILGVIR